MSDLQKNINEINKLPGLKKVKDEVKALVAYLQNVKDRKDQGLGEGPSLTLHLFFQEIQVLVKLLLQEFWLIFTEN